MMGTPANEHPRAFWNADLDEAVAHAVAVVREVRPQVVVTYDENGGYGHPDHIQAHRVAMARGRGRRRPGLPARPRRGRGTSAKVYWCCVPRSVLQQGIDALAAAGEESLFEGVDQRRRHPFRGGRRGGDRRGRRPRASRRTRTPRCGPTRPRSWSTGRSSRCPTTSARRFSAPSTTGWSGASADRPAPAPHGWEDDLFAGLAGMRRPGPRRPARRGGVLCRRRRRLAGAGRGLLAAAAGRRRAASRLACSRPSSATCCCPAGARGSPAPALVAVLPALAWLVVAVGGDDPPSRGRPAASPGAGPPAW